MGITCVLGFLDMPVCAVFDYSQPLKTLDVGKSDLTSSASRPYSRTSSLASSQTFIPVDTITGLRKTYFKDKTHERTKAGNEANGEFRFTDTSDGTIVARWYRTCNLLALNKMQYAALRIKYQTFAYR